MSRNRAIGKDNKLPWHIPDELKWFKRTTTGNVIIMGRRTWESIGRPLPNRETIVITQASIPGIRTARSLAEIDPSLDPRSYFIVGGAKLYRNALPECGEVYLSLIKREVDGDVFLERFEDSFEPPVMIEDHPEFSVLRYSRKK